MRNITVYLVITSAFLLNGCEKVQDSLILYSSTYKRVIESGTIRNVYISYPPSLIVDPNTGSFSGIFYDVIDQARRNMKLKMEFVEEVGWGTMIEALETNRVDIVVTGIWPTSTRGKRANFTKPIYYSTVRAYERADDIRFDGALKQINNPEVRIATIDGEMTSIIAAMDFPEAQTVALPQTSDVSQVLLEIVTNKADITFVEPAVAKAYIANNPGTIRGGS